MTLANLLRGATIALRSKDGFHEVSIMSSDRDEAEDLMDTLIALSRDGQKSIPIKLEDL